MRRAAALALVLPAALTMIAASEVGTSPTLQDCVDGLCTMRMTAPQLLATAEKLVIARRFEEVAPLLAALHAAPELAMETRFLESYVAAESGDLGAAARGFRTVLRDRPDLTRARLELARVLMLQGKDAAADHHYRLAEEAEDLPPEIERTIRTARGVIRTRKTWHVNVDAGLVPDSNITNATASRTVDIVTGQGLLPLTLDEDARAKSGVGQQLAVSSGVRLRLSDGMAMLVDADGQIVNQKGGAQDDISALIAAGPELTFTDGTRVAVQALGVHRWYGGKVATRGGGLRASFQKNLSAGARVGVQLDVRRTESGFGAQYDGWTYAGYATYERVVRKTMIASATVYARREDLRAKPYSSSEFGANLGIGGELPAGINAGLSAGVSRVLFDAPLMLLSPHERRDWRLNARAYVGTRAIRVLGFSPSLTYTYNRSASTLDLYQADRHRLVFGLARYF